MYQKRYASFFIGKNMCLILFGKNTVDLFIFSMNCGKIKIDG